jgi:hypothetical protein
MLKNLLLLVLFCNCAYSQQKDSLGLIIKFDAAQLIDHASFPNLHFQVEKQISRNFSIIGGVGVQVDKSTEADTSFVATRGLKLNLEARFYVSKRDNRRHPGHFVGVQAFYRANQKNQSLRYSTPSSTYYVDDFGVKKVIYGLNVMSGYQFIINEKKFPLILEPSVGIGIMNRKVTNYDLQYNRDIDEDAENHSFTLPSNLESASGFRPNFTIGMKIGYKF